MAGGKAGVAGNASVLTGGSSGEYVSVAGLRVDGRRSEEVRRIRTRLGLFQRVDGSAYYEQGNTKVVAVVYGPRELKSLNSLAAAANMSTSGAGTNVAMTAAGSGNQNQPRAIVNCEYTQAPFATSERKAQRSACILTHLYPKSQIDIFVQILHADGGEFPAAINAITLALIDAGIALNDFVVACSAGYLQQTILCDLNYTEESARAPQLLIALNPRTSKLNLVQMECKLPLEMFESLMGVAMEGCTQVYDILQSAVRENTWKRLRSRGAINA